mmetsp:Transcript_39128/g.122384  ORF Transcript_39128/g.122384 Transcript_39128/m.122384 type:complete len:226 (-) Transcript_39128:297-974(-)
MIFFPPGLGRARPGPARPVLSPGRRFLRCSAALVCGGGCFFLIVTCGSAGVLLLEPMLPLKSCTSSWKSSSYSSTIASGPSMIAGISGTCDGLETSAKPGSGVALRGRLCCELLDFLERFLRRLADSLARTGRPKESSITCGGSSPSLAMPMSMVSMSAMVLKKPSSSCDVRSSASVGSWPRWRMKLSTSPSRLSASFMDSMPVSTSTRNETSAPSGSVPSNCPP